MKRTIFPFTLIIFLTVSLFIITLMSCSRVLYPALTDKNEPVQIYDTHGSRNEADWTIIRGTPTNLDPQNTVLQNGLIRITYPCLDGMPGKTYPMYGGEKAGFVLWVKVNGTYINENFRNGDITFGDWTYVGGSVLSDPTGFRIIENTPDKAEIQIDFANHRMQAERKDIPNPFNKNIILHRGHYGYVAKINELGARPTIEWGEHEAGFGGTQHHLFTYSTSFGYLWNLSNPVKNYQFLRDQNNGNDDLWGTGLSFDNRYYRIVALKPQGPPAPTLRAYQFPGGCTAGIIRYNKYTAPWGSFEAYIGMVPYDGTDAMNITFDHDKAVVKVPKDGHYTLFSEETTDNGGSKRYVRVYNDLNLGKGKNWIDIAGKILKNPIIAPLSDGINFPNDIYLRYVKL